MRPRGIPLAVSSSAWSSSHRLWQGRVSGVGVAQVPALGVEYGVEAGDEHVGRYVGTQYLVGLRQHLAGQRSPTLGDGTQNALRARHKQGRRDPLARDVPDHHTYPAALHAEEIVEVPTHLAGGLVVRYDVPACERGHGVREQDMLDAPRHQQLLLEALAFDPLLLHALLPQGR